MEETARKLLRVRIGSRLFAVPISCICEILRMAELRSIPAASRRIAGALNLRGKILPVADFSSAVGEASREPDPEQYVVVSYSDSGEFGFVVDDTIDIVEVPASMARSLEGVDSAAGGLVRELVRIGDDLIPVLAPSLGLFSGDAGS